MSATAFTEFRELARAERELGLANLARYKAGGWCTCPSTPDEEPCESYFQREDGSHGWFHDPDLGGCGRLTQSG